MAEVDNHTKVTAILAVNITVNVTHLGQIDQIDHDLDYIDPNLPS